MTYASTPTLLSLDRWASIFGVSPVHFSGARITSPILFDYGSQCSDRWYQYNWQSSQYTSREDLARKIAEVEEELAQFVGYFLAPTWVENEPHLYPKDYDPTGSASVYSRIGRGMVVKNDYDIRGMHKGLTLDYGRFIQAGTRVVDNCTTVRVVYSDEDGDGFDETVTVTTPTTITDINEIKVYFVGHTEQEMEIRPPRTKTLVVGVFQATFYTWQFIKPELNEVFPGAFDTHIDAIDLSDIANLIADVDVCREYTDYASPGAKFYWEPVSGTTCPCCGGTVSGGCPACSHYEQDGCLFVRDIENGIGGVSPSYYDSTTGEWVTGNWDVCRPPDIAKTNYYSGDIDRRYLRGITNDPLSDFWAIIIAEMATARLTKPFCACGNINEVQEELRKDLTYTGQGESRYVTKYITDSPFGTHRGEVNAWMKLSKIVKKRGRVAVI